MLYKEYGTTGMKVSAIGFGGMRLPEELAAENAAALLKAAFDKGINYFDTAPGYGRSEDVFGLAFRSMPRDQFYVSTKSMGRKAEDVRKDVERSLKRMGLETIDVLHMWCVMDLEDFHNRIDHGVLGEMEKLKAEGLVRHIAISTHMNGGEMSEAFQEYPFEGVLLGYSAINFPYREKGIESAAARKMGVVVMNPLGGGLIPQHPDYFSYLKTRDGETVAEAALRFLLNDPAITVSLVGLSTPEQLAEAVSAVDGCRPLPENYKENLRNRSLEGDSMNKLCTSCGYCMPCPMKIPIVKVMDAYNHFILNGKTAKAITDRLHWHWRIEKEDSSIRNCIECGCCESKCTQKLPIIRRIATVKRACNDLPLDV